MSFVNYSSKLSGLGAITFTMDDTTVHGSDGWSFNVKAAFDAELRTELAHPPITAAHTIVGMMIGITDANFRTVHGTPGNVLSDFGAFANTGAFQAHFNPLSDAWYSALVGSASVPPVVSSFTATPEAIFKGQVAYLDWAVSGQVSSVSIDQGIGPVQISGRRGVIPNVTTTYKLTARGIGGTSYASETVTVNASTVSDTGAGTGTDTGGTGDTTTPPPPESSNMTMYLVIGGIALLGFLAMRH